jgi:hypothetical protein
MKFWLTALLTTFMSISALGQQDYVPRYDAFTGFSYLASPKMNLAQRGYNQEFGINVNRWLALGGDYSVFDGHSSLAPSELATTIQAQLSHLTLPPGYVLSVPFEAKTSTYSAGPQFNIRRFKPVTIFVRPALGILHERVRAKPSDAIQTAVVAALVPGGTKSDTTVFYGGQRRLRLEREQAHRHSRRRRLRSCELVRWLPEGSAQQRASLDRPHLALG